MMKFELRTVALAVCLAYCAAPAFATDTATIQQSGSNGTATINQVGNTGNANSVITQGSGDGNAAFIDQSGILQSDLAASASARIDQVGNGNSAQLSQTGSDQQDAAISQTGDRNSATIHALAGKAGASVLQVGNDNGADVTFGTSASGLSISQAGNNNYALMSEHDGGFFDVRSTMNGDGNSAFIDVTGVGNVVLTQQTGDFNELHVTQDNPPVLGGSNNVATITQSSSFNFASITQVGAGLIATIVQDTGNHNTATINQHF